MSEKLTEKKTHDHYYVGDYLWRITDNALFKITNVTLDDREDGSVGISSYDLTCVNHAPVEDVTVYLEMVHDTGSIYTKYPPSKPVKGQHVWNTSIDPVCHDKYRHDYYHDKCENEFIVEDVVEKKPETIIILMNLSGHKKQTITLEQFNASYTMLPPDIYEIDKFVKEEIKSIRDNSLGCEESEEKTEIDVDNVMNQNNQCGIIMKNNVKKIIYDVIYKNIKPELDKIIEVGDFWTYSSFAGSFDWDLSSSSASSYRYRTLGSRLSKDKKYWKVFNHGSCGEQYNINVHFNDNDEIICVEWIEDSKFDAIDKSIMYSIYEDLKKYEVSQVLIVETDNTDTNISKALEIASSEEAEKSVNDQIEKEAVDTGIEDYFEIWKKSLKVVTIPKFDLNYFTKGFAYHVNKVTSNYPGEFYGIMVEATENLLRVMKLGTHIHIESTEIIEIPLKEYLNGDWHVVRLVEEV